MRIWRHPRGGDESIVRLQIPSLLTWEADHMATDKAVTVRTTISGIVNDETLRGRVSATLNTAGGGRSSCSFTKLPTGFTPATLGTHA
jgi:hypothetical protein